jgi:hypothetical protein
MGMESSNHPTFYATFKAIFDATFIAILIAVVPAIYISGLPILLRPDLLLLSSCSNRRAVSISDRRIWEPKEVSQFAQWELSERDVINPAYTCPVERCQEKSLAYVANWN